MIKSENGSLINPTLENLIDSTKLSLFSLFTVDKEHQNLTFDEAK